MQKKDNSVMVLAIVLIAAGVIWLFKQTAGFPFFTEIHLHHYFFPFRHITTGITSTLLSWQMVLIFTGLVLIAGRRRSGIVLMVLGGVFLLPQILHLSIFSFSFLIPVILITTGIIVIIRASLNVKP